MTSILFQMDNDLNILENGRRPQYFGKGTTTSMCWQMEDDLNILGIGRLPQYFGKWKTTSIFCQIEDDLKILSHERRPHYFVKQKVIVGDIKTASCKLEFSGGKRKQGINEEENIKLGERETGGQPSNLSKLSFLPGDQTE